MSNKVISLQNDPLIQDNTTKKIAKPYEIKGFAGATSGLRLSQEEYNKPEYLEQFIQGIATYYKKKATELHNNTLVVGGDPRLGNKERVEKCIQILVANGFKVITSPDYIISTPAVSTMIKEKKTIGAIILTASHNPFTDVGIKVNDELSGGMLDVGTKEIQNIQNKTTEYKISTKSISELEKAGSLELVDATKIYADVLDKMYNFAEMKKLIAKNKHFQVALDGMSGAAGPFLKEIYINRLGLIEGKNLILLNCTPDKYLGGLCSPGHPKCPESDFSFIPDLIRLNKTGYFDLLAAYDSDVDRRLDGGKKFWIESADEFALLNDIEIKNEEPFNIKSYFEKSDGIRPEKNIFLGRSLVTAPAIDRVMPEIKKYYDELGYKVDFVETPTGFKYLSKLGNWGVEESNGMGNLQHGEKDGIATTIMLLKAMLKTKKSVKELMEDHWKTYGRDYFTRGEVSDPVKTEGKDTLIKIFDNIIKNPQSFVGLKFGELILEKAEKVAKYIDPLSKETVDPLTWAFTFSNGNKICARFSGTGSGGYCLRVYGFKYDKKYDLPKKTITQPLKDAFDALLANCGFKDKTRSWTDADQPDPYEKGLKNESKVEKKPALKKSLTELLKERFRKSAK